VDLPVLVKDGVVIAAETEVGVPGPDESIEGLRFVAEVRIRLRLWEDVDHGFSRGPGSPASVRVARPLV
jgi:hypothetical protein